MADLGDPRQSQGGTGAPSAASGAGPGRILVAVYATFALAATGRSILQIATYFDRAPVAYLLSALAAVIYIVATVTIARGDRISLEIAYVACTIELVGVLGVGLWSYLQASAFPDKTVWSHFGQGYGFVPVMLPVLGLWWLRAVRRRARGPARGGRAG